MTSLLPDGHRYLHRIAPTPLVPVQLQAERPSCLVQAGVPQSRAAPPRTASPATSSKRPGGRDGSRPAIMSSKRPADRPASRWRWPVRNSVCDSPPSCRRASATSGVLIIRGYGGQVRFSPEGSRHRGAIAETERLAQEPGTFLPRQFANPDNAEAHRVGTAREIIDQIPGGRVDAVVSGVGTGGTLMGLFQGFQEAGCDVRPALARSG